MTPPTLPMLLITLRYLALLLLYSIEYLNTEINSNSKDYIADTVKYGKYENRKMAINAITISQ